MRARRPHHCCRRCFVSYLDVLKGRKSPITTRKELALSFLYASHKITAVKCTGIKVHPKTKKLFLRDFVSIYIASNM